MLFASWEVCIGKNCARAHCVPKYIYICVLFAGQEVRFGKNCARDLVKDQPEPANNMFIFCSLENYFIRNICVDFLLKQFHTVRVCLTFWSSKPVLFTEVFKRSDSVFADFRTEQ